MLVRDFKAQVAEMFGAGAVKVSKVPGGMWNPNGQIWWVEVWMPSPHGQRSQYLMGNRPFRYSVDQYSLADVFEQFARSKRGE
jgi:hypothetical protein